MVQVKYLFPVEELSGKVANQNGLVFFNWRGVLVARRFVVPSNPDTLPQQTSRSFMSAASQQFGSITAQEKIDWEAYAELNPSERFGIPFVMPAISAYTQVNTMRQLGNVALSDVAPTTLTDFSITGITSVTVVATDLQIVLTHSASVLTSKFVLVKITAPLNSPRVNPPRSAYQMIAPPQDFKSIIALAASPQTVTIALADIWTTIAAADSIGVSIQAVSPEYVTSDRFTQVELVA